MHFRIRRHVIQLIRTHYDNAGKRAVSTQVGSVPLDAEQLPEELAQALSEDERAEFQAFFESHRRVEALEGELAALTLVRHIERASNWLQRQGDVDLQQRIEAELTPALRRLKKVLTRSAVL